MIKTDVATDDPIVDDRSTPARVGTDVGEGIGCGSSIESSGTGPIHFTNTAAVASNLSTGVSFVLGGTNMGDNTMAALFNGTGATFAVSAIVKNGAGKWILTNNNTYLGTTTVNDGTLLINGDQSGATGAVAVNGPGILGGSGTVGGSVTVDGTGSIAPGASAGTLSIAGGLNISALAAGAGTLAFELGSDTASSDQIAVTGTLTIGVGNLSVSDFTFTNLGGLQNGTYVLITSGGINGGDSVDGTSGAIAGGSGTGMLQINGNNIELVVSGVGAATPFDTWAGTGTMGPVTFGGDTNGDGVKDGLAFLLGADDPDVNATALLPTVSGNAGDLVMEFTCLAAADRGASVLNLEWDGTLAGPWSSVGVPGAVGTPSAANGTGTVGFVVTSGGTNGNGDALIDIKATIDDDTEAAGGRLFGRLQATK